MTSPVFGKGNTEMNKGRAIQAIRAQELALRQAGIRALYLFGSTVRNEARDDSEVDIDIDIDETRKFSLSDIFDVRQLLDEALGGHCDVVTRGGLHPSLKDRIEREAEKVL